MKRPDKDTRAQKRAARESRPMAIVVRQDLFLFLFLYRSLADLHYLNIKDEG